MEQRLVEVTLLIMLRLGGGVWANHNMFIARKNSDWKNGLCLNSWNPPFFVKQICWIYMYLCTFIMDQYLFTHHKLLAKIVFLNINMYIL